MYLIFFHFNGGIHLKQQNQGDLNKMTINCTQKGSEFNASDLARHKNTQYSPVLPPTFLFGIFNSSFPREQQELIRPSAAHSHSHCNQQAECPAKPSSSSRRIWRMVLPLKVEGPNHQVFFWKTLSLILHLSKRAMPAWTQTREVPTDTPCEANVAVQGACVCRSNARHHSTPPCSASSI